MTKNTIKQTHKDNIQTVAAPLNTLELSSLNPRQNPDEKGIEALALSIKAVGLLQNIIGIKTTDTISIVAGGRRLRALQMLAEQGDIEKNTTVLVRLATNEDQAMQWAATENEARENLSPADEVRSYKAMLDAGMKADQIAIANAKTVRHVKGRLRLASLSPTILEALGTGHITLDTAAAYTISDSHEKQNEVFEAMNKQTWWTNDTQQIRSTLTSEVPDQHDISVIFVTRDLYEKKGGTVREDLFGDQSFYPDIELLDKLAQDKMDQIVTDLKAEGWKWADMHLTRRPWDFHEDFDRLHPTKPDVSSDTEARLEALETRMNEETITEEELAEFDQLEASAQPFFRDHAKAVSGVAVFISHSNEIEYSYGLVREEDRADAIAHGLIELDDETPHTQANNNTGPYSQALAADLTTIRTGAIQSAILGNPKLARDLAIFALAYPVYAGVCPMTITKKIIKNQVDEHGQTLPEDLEHYPAEHMDDHEASQAFDTFIALSDKMKLALLTEAVAKSFQSAMFFEDRPLELLENIVNRLDVSVRETWTPNSTFFNRLKSPQLDEVMSYILQKPAGHAFTKSAKRDKVARLHALFNNDVDRRGFSDDEKQRIANWCPECLSTIALDHCNEEETVEDDTLPKAA